MKILGGTSSYWEALVNGVVLWVYVTEDISPTEETSRCNICGEDTEVFRTLVTIDSVVEENTDCHVSLSDEQQIQLQDMISNEIMSNEPEICLNCIAKEGCVHPKYPNWLRDLQDEENWTWAYGPTQ